MRAVEAKERIKWSKKHGNDTYLGGCSDSGDEDSEDDVKNQSKSKKQCACGSTTHQRSSHKDCPFNKRNVFSSDGTPGITDVGSPSSGGCASKPVGVPNTLEEKPVLQVGDYVTVHTRRVGGRHLPCRVVVEVCGRFQLYCSKGILDTTYCHTELTHLTVSFPTVPLDNWRLSPRISMRKAASDQELVANCECHNIISPESLIVSLSSEEESEVSDLWVNNGAYCLNGSERRLVISPKGWLTDRIISTAEILLLQFHPNVAGLQPPVLQKVYAFQVHSGEFVQVVHVRNNHWCVVSTVGCESGVVHVYDSLYKTVSKDLVHLIATMVYSKMPEIKIVMMDVEQQTNGSDCGVLTIAYAFDICSGFNPCVVRFDHSRIRHHLANCLENCQVARFPILGDRESVNRKPMTVELHCSCRMPEEKGDQIAECDSCHIWYHRHCMDIPSDVFGESEVYWECKRCAN